MRRVELLWRFATVAQSAYDSAPQRLVTLAQERGCHIGGAE